MTGGYTSVALGVVGLGVVITPTITIGYENMVVCVVHGVSVASGKD